MYRRFPGSAIAAISTAAPLDESGLKGFDVQATYMLMAPARTPSDIIAKISAAVTEIQKLPEVRKFLDQINAHAEVGGPEQTKAFLRSEEAKWTHVVAVTGVKAD